MEKINNILQHRIISAGEQHRELIEALEIKCVESQPSLQLTYTSKFYRKHILEVNV